MIVRWKCLVLKAPIRFSWFNIKKFLALHIWKSGGWISHIEDREKYDGGLPPVEVVVGGSLSISERIEIPKMTLIYYNSFKTTRIWSDYIRIWWFRWNIFDMKLCFVISSWKSVVAGICGVGLWNSSRLIHPKINHQLSISLFF